MESNLASYLHFTVGKPMFLTLLSGICLNVLGIAAFINWDKMGAQGEQAEMLMPTFFGGALIICVLFSRQHYKHGLYGALTVAMLGVISSIVRMYQYEKLQSFNEPKTLVILAMFGICAFQMAVSWNTVKKDRALPPPA